MEGQFSIFDYIDSEKNIHISPVEKKAYKAPQIKCLGKECNHDVLIEVAKGLGYDCKTDCCLKCNARFCGARCNYSVSTRRSNEQIFDRDE